MKSILFVLGLSLIASVATAQRFSTGLRTGLDYVPTVQQPWDVVKGSSLGWNKSAFVRYESKGRFAIDLSVAHSRFHYTFSISDLTEFAGPTHETLKHWSNNDAFTGNLAVQFRVTDNESPIRSYFGAGISYGREIGHNNVISKDLATEEISKTESTYFYGVAHCGLNNYTSYTINKHLNVHSAISFDIDPFEALSGFRLANQFPQSRLSGTIGCGYTF